MFLRFGLLIEVIYGLASLTYTPSPVGFRNYVPNVFDQLLRLVPCPFGGLGQISPLLEIFILKLLRFLLFEGHFIVRQV